MNMMCQNVRFEIEKKLFLTVDRLNNRSSSNKNQRLNGSAPTDFSFIEVLIEERNPTDVRKQCSF